MTGDLFDRIRNLFDEALQQPESERVAFVRSRCGDDVALLEEVLSLLRADAGAGDFLGGSAVASIGGEDAWIGRTVGNYRIESVIAGGGMGVVFRARQEAPAREVALKLIRGDALSARALQRFQQEAELLGRLDHPGIARIYDAGTTDAATGRQPYFVMELIDGLPLMEFARRRDLPVEARLDLMIRICEAVEHAHRNGIVHRDLKPANILVREDGQPKVLDFGVARTTDSDLVATSFRTEIGQIIGTLPYMSPEQIRGAREEIDTRSDVYALGVLLYELLTGRLPQSLKGKSLAEAARLIEEEEPSSLGESGRRFSSDLETIVRKCLEKDRDQRYDTPGDLALDLGRYLASQPVAARPPSVVYQLRKFARRNRGVVLTAALGFVVLVAGLVVSVMGWSRAARERERWRIEAEKSKAIGGFMTRVLGSPDPWQDGPDVKVVDVLGQADRRVDEELAGQPEVAASVHLSLGETWWGLSDYDAAERHWRAAYDLLASVLPPDDPGLYPPLENLADLALDRGDLARADSFAVSMRALLPRFPPGSTQAIDALLFLGNLEMEHGRMDEAVIWMQQAYDRSTAEIGRDSETTAVAASTLGNLLWQMDRATEAAPLLEWAAQRYEALHGEDYPELFAILNNLSFAYQSLDRNDEALALFLDLLERKRRVMGDSTGTVALGEHSVAWQLRQMGRYEEALPHHDAAVSLAEAVLGEDDMRLHAFRAARGSTLLDLGRTDEARTDLESAYRNLRALLGPDHPRCLRVAATLADACERLGDTGAAERYRAIAEDSGS